MARNGTTATPIYGLEAQSRHLSAETARQQARTARVLTLFALALTFAVGCMLVLVGSSTAHAAATVQAGSAQADLALGLAAIGSFAAVAAVVAALMRTLSTAGGHRGRAADGRGLD